MIIPKEVKTIIKQLEKDGFEAFIVGGCVRDLIRKEDPKDWDIATSAKPEEIKNIFPDSFYENKFLTVTVRTKSKDEKLKEIEITTYRKEANYSDKRHPDKIDFAKSLKEDLARRDFTINAIAISLKKKCEIIDFFNGQKDLKNKIIQTVGNPQERFSEDALRMIRAARFATTLSKSKKDLDWKIEAETFGAIVSNAHLLEVISKERIRDEFIKIILSSKPKQGIELLKDLGLLKYIIPELEEGYKVDQNKHHIYDCWDHSLYSLSFTAEKNFNFYVRMAALLHDIAKPRVKKGQGSESTFYNHEIVGAKMTNTILNRLKFSKKDIKKIVLLVRYHLFYYNVGEVSASSVRRLVRRVGIENMKELLELRMADRIGSGVPKAEPYKLRHLRYLIEKVSQDPITVKMLCIDGNKIMKTLNISPGPKIGYILDILLGYVLSNPEKNKADFLEKETLKLGKINDSELKSLSMKAKQEREKIETKKDQMTKNKYWVT